ncbi:MAG: hypothetical protein Q7S50_02480 [bacterium]|nr:hypothetical protein [bacterium]
MDRSDPRSDRKIDRNANEAVVEVDYDGTTLTLEFRFSRKVSYKDIEKMWEDPTSFLKRSIDAELYKLGWLGDDGTTELMNLEKTKMLKADGINLTCTFRKENPKEIRPIN